MFGREAGRDAESAERERFEGKLRERKLLGENEQMPDFDTCLEAFIESAETIGRYIRKRGVKTVVFLDRGSRNIAGALRAAAEELGMPLPTVKFIDNHLLSGESNLTTAWEETAEPPILIVDEIAVSGESLAAAKKFLGEKFGTDQVTTAALTVNGEAAIAHTDLKGQTATSLSLGYWYLSRSRPRELKDILAQTALPDDLMISPVQRDPDGVWFTERNEDAAQAITWRALDGFIKERARTRAREVKRHRITSVGPETVKGILLDGDSQEIAELFSYGDDATLDELKRLLIERAATPEDRAGIEKRFDVGVKLQRLRLAVHDDMKLEVKARLDSGRQPTAEELAMGAFIEELEPQVRDAMLAMRRKGYGTASSGFSAFDLQSLDCTDDCFSHVDASTREQLAKMGVSVSDGSLEFSTQVTELDDIRKIWDAIAAALPDRGAPAPDATHLNALNFRKKY